MIIAISGIRDIVTLIRRVLINKLGIKDEEKLRIAEREITSLRIANAKISVLKRVHKFSRQ